VNAILPVDPNGVDLGVGVGDGVLAGVGFDGRVGVGIAVGATVVVIVAVAAEGAVGPNVAVVVALGVGVRVASSPSQATARMTRSASKENEILRITALLADVTKACRFIITPALHYGNSRPHLEQSGLGGLVLQLKKKVKFHAVLCRDYDQGYAKERSGLTLSDRLRSG
jgi:hypothetical protein